MKHTTKITLVLLAMILLISILSGCSIVDTLNELDESIPASLGVSKDTFWLYIIYIAIAIGALAFFIAVGEKESVIVLGIFGIIICIVAFIAFLASSI